MSAEADDAFSRQFLVVQIAKTRWNIISQLHRQNKVDITPIRSEIQGFYRVFSY